MPHINAFEYKLHSLELNAAEAGIELSAKEKLD